MSKIKKTCFNVNINKTGQISQNKKVNVVQNKIMKQNKKNNSIKSNCQLHVMPPQITDEDISALFNGIIGIVKKKIELETKSEILNTNISLENALKKLKEKEAECIRLKNEIINLKSKFTPKPTQNS